MSPGGAEEIEPISASMHLHQIFVFKIPKNNKFSDPRKHPQKYKRQTVSADDENTAYDQGYLFFFISSSLFYFAIFISLFLKSCLKGQSPNPFYVQHKLSKKLSLPCCWQVSLNKLNMKQSLNYPNFTD